MSTIATQPDQTANVHPLDDCDPADCYKTMMSERTELIKARREAEDNLIKTIIQISSTLVALISGFIVQYKFSASFLSIVIISLSVTFFLISIIFGLAEQFFSSKAYLEQQKFVEEYFDKKITTYGEPSFNRWVRRCQISSFAVFVLGLLSLGGFAIIEGQKLSHDNSSVSAASASAASAAAAAAAAAAAPAPKVGSTVAHCKLRNNEIGRTLNAATPTKEQKVTC